MVIIIAESFPDHVRGMLKRWFVEPKPNVFVGSVNEKVREKLLNYIKRNTVGLKYLLIYSDSSNCQGFVIENNDPSIFLGITISGLNLIAKKYL